MKKIILIALAMLMVVLPVFAGDTLIRWDWLLNDSSVQYYRYQVDGTEPDAWTTVDGSVSYYETDALDPYTDHTLYLESSYDGMYWSETASAVAYALPVPAVEEAVIVAEEPAAVVEEPVIVVEETAAEVAAPEVAPLVPVSVPTERANDFAFSLLFKGGFISDSTVSPFKLAFEPEINLGLGLDFANIIRLGNNGGIGFRTDFDFVAVPVTGYYDNVFNGAYVFKNSSYEGYKADATGYLTLTARAGFAAFNLGLGGGASFGFGDGDAENQSVSFTLADKEFSVGGYGALNAGMRFYLGSVFSFGLEGGARIMLPNYQDVRYSADVVLGFTF